MKKLVIETGETALESLLGEKITLFCANYIYTGVLIGVNTQSILLKDPSIVYETGCFKSKNYKDEQSLNVSEFFISIASIESFGKLK